jgi:hypothetical protein
MIYLVSKGKSIVSEVMMLTLNFYKPKLPYSIFHVLRIDVGDLSLSLSLSLIWKTRGLVMFACPTIYLKPGQVIVRCL